MSWATRTVSMVVYPDVQIVDATGPLEEGLVASLARPGGNVTGLATETGPHLEGKRLEVLREALAKLRRVAYLAAKADWEGPGGMSIRAAAKALGLVLFLAEFRPNDYAGAFALIAREQPHAIITSLNPHHYTYRGLIAEFAARNKRTSCRACPTSGTSR